MFFEVKKGGFKFELSEPIEVANKGAVEQATRLKLEEPVKDSEYDAIELAQFVTRAGLSVSKIFAGMNQQEEELKAEGEEIIPFHLQDVPDVEKLLKETTGLIKVLKAGDVDIKQFISTGKRLLTTRYSGSKRRICTIDDSEGSAFTPYLFDELSFQDKFCLVASYCVFFGISSIGEPKTISSKELV